MDLSKFQQNNKFLMLALDQRGSFKKAAGTDNDQALISTKRKIIKALADEFSGLLIDPQWGLPAYQSKDKPFLLCIEKSGYEETASGRTTQLAYTAKQLKQQGASGVKLLVYFNPLSETANHQLNISQQVLAECQSVSLPLFLEIVTYDLDKSLSKHELILKSLDMYLEHNIQPDVFKLEFPGSVQACQYITDKLKHIPWILLTAGKPFETFKAELLQAKQAGVSGFLAGRAIWQEIFDYQDLGQEKFLKTTSLPRFKTIKKIMLS